MAQLNQTIGKYRILTDLGGGTYGRVYKAQHTFFSNRLVALKIMRALPLTSQQERDAFLKEAQYLEILKHPNILPVIDVDLHDDLPYLILEYAPGGSLRDRLTRQGNQPLPQSEAIAILTQIGAALQYAHDKTIIHRDLKPENLLFNARGDILVADFGIATMLATLGTHQGTAVGTYPYMAPRTIQRSGLQRDRPVRPRLHRLRTLHRPQTLCRQRKQPLALV